MAPYSKIIRDACNQSKYHDVLDLLAYIDVVTPQLFLTTEIIFAVLFVMFAIVSATTIVTLKRSVPLLYSQYRAFLIASSLSLTVPLALRFVLDVMYTKDQHWRHFLNNPDKKARFSLYSMLDFIVTTLVPIVSQLSTLVFGFIRKSLSTLQEQAEKPLFLLGEKTANDSSSSDSESNYFDPPIDQYYPTRFSGMVIRSVSSSDVTLSPKYSLDDK